MLIGITVDYYKGIKPSKILKLTRRIGLQFVEITKSVFDDLPDVLNSLGKTKTGFHLPNYGDNGFDFSCPDREQEIDRLIKQINRHHNELNIQYCLSHPPECPKSDIDKATIYSFLFEKLNQLKPPVILENVQGLNEHQFNEFYVFAQKELGDKLIGQCFDAPHYFVRGDNPVSILDNYNGLIKCVHLSDCRTDKDSHLPFGRGGKLPIDDILHVLKKHNYNNIINLELLPRSQEDIKAVVDSYLKIQKAFSKFDYYQSKLKLLFSLPILKKLVR